jgi:glucan 1,3-beta-glucosidase
VLRLLEKHDLKAIIDIHTMKDSQNGFDNGGRAMDVVWTSTSATNPAGVATFQHWPVRAAHWIGTFNRENGSYTNINHDNIDHALRVRETDIRIWWSCCRRWS